jgi:hypothetical protein
LKIERALKEAEAGDFATDAEVREIFESTANESPVADAGCGDLPPPKIPV